MLRPVAILFALGLSVGGAFAQARLETAPTRSAFSVVQPSGKPFAIAPTVGAAKPAAPRTARGPSSGAIFIGPTGDTPPASPQAAQGQPGPGGQRQTAAAPAQRAPQPAARAIPAGQSQDDPGEAPPENGQQPQEGGAQPGEAPDPANAEAPTEGNAEQ